MYLEPCAHTPRPHSKISQTKTITYSRLMVFLFSSMSMATFFCFFFISSPASARPLQHKTNLSNFRILRTVTPLLSVPFDEGPGINSRDFDGIENIRRGGKLQENSAKRRRIVRVFRGLWLFGDFCFCVGWQFVECALSEMCVVRNSIVWNLCWLFGKFVVELC